MAEEETFDSWSISQVADWVRNDLKMPEHIVNLFVQQEIDGSALETLTMDELQGIGVNTLGKQKAIMKALTHLKGNPPPNFYSSNSLAISYQITRILPSYPPK